MRAFAPRRIGPLMSSTDVNDDAHVGHRSTSVKTDHTTSIGASIVIDARSPPSFAMTPLLSALIRCSPIVMYQMVHSPGPNGQPVRMGPKQAMIPHRHWSPGVTRT